MKSELGQPLATFRPTLAPICRLALGLFMVVAIVAVPAALLKGRPLIHTFRGLLVAAAFFAALVPVLGAIVWPLGVSVYAEGIRGRCTWGRKVFIPWAAISEVAAHNASGMLFLIIKAGPRGSDIWTLPDVVSREEFQRLISGLANPANPLRIEPSPAVQHGAAAAEPKRVPIDP